MRKLTATILSVCAISCVCAAFATAKTADFRAPLTATASSSATEATTLLSPLSYEQYLSLQAPSDIVLSKHYNAIADGTVIYVFDKQSGVYRQYEHTEKVTKLQFDSEENLYFLDATASLRILNPATLAESNPTVTDTEYRCNNFIIQGEYLYSTTMASNIYSKISRAPLSDLRADAAITLQEDVILAPVLAYYNNELYYTYGKYLRKINPQTKDAALVAEFPSVLLSLSISDNKLCCVTDDGDFYVYDLPTLSANKTTEDTPYEYASANDYTALSQYEKFVYVVRDNVIKQYAYGEKRFTDYEISGASSALHRFNGATDAYLCDDRLLIADNGNRRISIYDTTAQTFSTPVTVAHSVDYVTAYDDTLLVANTSQATLIDLSPDHYGATLTEKTNFSGNLVGVASVYGAYYLVSDKNYYYALTETANTEGATLSYQWTTAHKTSTDSPTALTADAYGNLYVACGSGILTYTENSFMETAVSKEKLLLTLPVTAEKIAVDYRGNVYALTENNLYKYAPVKTGGAYVQTNLYYLGDEFVYGVTPKANSFAFSIQENVTYVLYENNYVTKTTKLDLPTVKNIPVNGADNELFNVVNTDSITVVQTDSNALLIRFDINALQGAAVFPYLSHERSVTAKTALKIGQTDVYDLLAVYDETQGEYATYLVYSSACKPLSNDEYHTAYEEKRTGYLSNSVRLYTLPYLTELLTACEMPRGAQVNIIGEIQRLDRPYYHVEYVDEQGETHVGYIPQAYVTPTRGAATPQTVVLGDTRSRTDAYGRLIYLLLGTAAIGALVDYLILHKPKDEQQD